MAVYATWLADAARTTGYRVVEIAGWRTRGHGKMRLVEGVVGHHTATSAAAKGDYPSLNIVTNGRSDLAGPLCNLGLGRDGTIYIVAAGVGYHAGASRWAGFTDLNDEFLGIEAESPGNGEWTAPQRDCYPKLVGALLKYMNRGVDRYAGHKDVALPKGRKPDPVGIDTGWMQNTARAFIAGGAPKPQEADMDAHEHQLLVDIHEALFTKRQPSRIPGDTNTTVLNDAIMDTVARVSMNEGRLNAANAKIDALTAIVGKQSGVTADQIAAALRAGLTADLLPVLKAVLEDALEDDNGEQADAISTQVLEKLATKLTPQQEG